MKCPSCGYNTFDYSESCTKCGASLKSILIKSGGTGKTVKGRIQKSVDEVGLFEEDDPVLLDEEIEDYSFHGKTSVSDQEQSTAVNDSDEKYLELASLKRRFFAFTIDILIILLIPVPTIIIGLVAVGIDPVQGALEMYYILVPVYVILCLLASTCLIFLPAYSGKSIGKLLFGIRVIKEDGGRIYFNDSFVRWIGYYLSSLPLFYGYISALFDYNLQTWHDKISKTYVIKDG